MAAEATIHEKEHGIYYTPAILAEYLAKPLVFKGASILDPAYGEGSLLLAAEKVYFERVGAHHLSLYGCDIKPVNGLLTHLPEANLKRINFFDYPLEHKFRIILMNPPYVRHHKLSGEHLAEMRKKFPDLNKLASVSDLWAYFILKSLLHLEPGGSIGAILPWSFLQADYSFYIREKLADHFGEIRLLSLSGKHFEKAQERVVLVWLNKYGSKCELFESGYSRDVDDQINFIPTPVNNWLSKKVVYANNDNWRSLLNACQEQFGFSKFSDHADVKIGVVTGADKFFILDKAEAKRQGFKSKNLKPIITTSKEFADVLLLGAKNLKRLIVVKKTDYKKHQSYLLKGHAKEIPERAHPSLRKPWYAVKVGTVPDSFFPYRINRTPYLLPNLGKFQCTNSVHRIYFKNLTPTEIKWIHVSTLAVMSQLSIEVNSKTYGRGMLKIEPSSLKNALVLVRRDEAVIPVYDLILKELENNRKSQASKIATAFVKEYLRIPDDFIIACKEALQRIEDYRTQ